MSGEKTGGHKFWDSHNKAEAEKHEPFWLDIYKEAFGNYVSNAKAAGDFKIQRMGIDRVIVLDNGLTYNVDEKLRFKEFDDILLEYVSNDQTNAPGWMEKDLAIHYLAYAFKDSQRCFLFDWVALKRAWRYYGEQWKKKYKTIEATNENQDGSFAYKTLCVAIPIKVIQETVSGATLIDIKKSRKSPLSVLSKQEMIRTKAGRRNNGTDNF